MSDAHLTKHACQILETLGEQIETARRRRGWSQKQLAERAMVGEVSVRRLEHGHHGSRLSTVANVLTALSLENSLLEVANPDQDEIGKELAKRQLPKRAGKGVTNELDTDF